MRSIDPSGNIVDTDQVWWWQLPDTASPAEVRQACFRNALSEVACASEVHDVLGAVTRVIGTFAFALAREGRQALRREGTLRVQAMVDWAMISEDREVQGAVDLLWREVLQHHRDRWEEEAQKLIDRWNDPTSPLHDLRRRLQGDAEGE